MSLMERMVSGVFEHTDITSGCEQVGMPVKDHSVYLRRWFIMGGTSSSPFGLRIMLHKFLQSDSDYEMHDHPWPFLSFILWRGYNEETEEAEHALVGGRFNMVINHHRVVKRKWPFYALWRPATWKHRVLLIDKKPAWSLVFTFGKSRSWGFWRRGDFIPWKRFLQEKCSPAKVVPRQ